MVRSFLKIAQRNKAQDKPADNEAEQAPASANGKIGQDLNLQDEASIINLVNRIIDQAHKLRASDIHIDPQQDDIRVRFRVDGVLHEAHSLPKRMHDEIISRIKIVAGLRTDEHQAAQDGRFRTNLHGDVAVDVRVSGENT